MDDFFFVNAYCGSSADPLRIRFSSSLDEFIFRQCVLRIRSGLAADPFFDTLDAIFFVNAYCGSAAGPPRIRFS
jgi:hypothetical protein